MSTSKFKGALKSKDFADGLAFWANHEVRKWAVHIWTGKDQKPTTERIEYARASTSERAIACVKRDALLVPARAKFAARLAGPHELGCVRVSVPE